MPGASFGILGPLEVSVSDAPVEIPATQLRRLLCLLLLALGRPVATPTIVECLWPAEDPVVLRPKDAGKTLRVYTSRLRRALPPGTGPLWDVRGYRIVIDGDDVDANRFEVLLERSAAQLRRDPAAAAATLQSALDLWRGPALVDCRDEEWAVGAAARLEELRLAALERLVDARLACGEHAVLCGELEELVAAHPLRERLWAQLILALYRTGRQADALRAFERVRRLLSEELGLDPGRELAALQDSVLRQDHSLDIERRAGGADTSATLDGGPDVDAGLRDAGIARPRRRRGITPLTSFVGRDRELRDVAQIARRARLLTVAGPPGIGKTRLALRLLDELEPSSDGTFVVDLAPVADPADVPAAVATVLGVRVAAGSQVPDALARAVGNENLLIMLDNCEQVTAPCAVLCRFLLEGCPGVRIVATSRRPLGVDVEVVYRVPPLGSFRAGAPAAPDDDALALFVERAQAHHPGFGISEGEHELLAGICERLDRIPLAIELAAARMGVLTLRELGILLDERYRILAEGDSSKPSRQRTLSASIAWSYELLDRAEQETLRRLAVFPAGFGLDAASSVVGRDDRWSALDPLFSLVEQSLVLADAHGGEVRYRLLETIRQFARAKLHEGDGPAEHARLSDRHAAHYLDLAVRAAPLIHTRDQLEWLWTLEHEYDNLRAAFDHLARRGARRDAMALAVALGRFLDWSGREAEVFRFVEVLGDDTSADRCDPVAVLFDVLRLKHLGRVDPARAVGQLEILVAAARRLGDEGPLAEALTRLTWALSVTGRPVEAARTHAEAVAAGRASGDPPTLESALASGEVSRDDLFEVLELCRESGDGLREYATLHSLGAIALREGDVPAAQRWFAEAIPRLEAVQPPGGHPELLVNTATVLLLDGSYESARIVYRQAVMAARRQLFERQLSAGLVGEAVCAFRCGDAVAAATLVGAAGRHLERTGFVLNESLRRVLADEEPSIRSVLGPAGFEKALARGRSLSRDDAAAVALGRSGPFLPVADTGSHRVSAR